MKLIMTISIVLFFMASTAFATTGLEFLSLGATQESTMLKPIIIEFVGQGYKNVPDWCELGGRMEELIRKNGWATNDVNEIALAAAKSLGMTE